MRFNVNDYLKAFPRSERAAASQSTGSKDPDPGDALEEEPGQVIEKKDPDPDPDPEPELETPAEGGEQLGDE